MAVIDFILNLAGLSLWLNWLSIRYDPMGSAPAATLAGTIKKTANSDYRHWGYLVSLAGLLAIRAFMYRLAGPELAWTPQLELGLVSLPFSIDDTWQMLLFSTLAFILALAIFYSWVLFLSMVNGSLPDSDPLQKLVRLHFRWLEPLPVAVKAMLPFLGGAVFWLALHPLLLRLTIVPDSGSVFRVLRQSAAIGIAAYLTWKYLLVAILLLHLLNSYVYFGPHAIWTFVNSTARNLLLPLRWMPLRTQKVDFLPVLAVALVFLLAEAMSHPPRWLQPLFYRLLPF